DARCNAPHNRAVPCITNVRKTPAAKLLSRRVRPLAILQSYFLTECRSVEPSLFRFGLRLQWRHLRRLPVVADGDHRKVATVHVSLRLRSDVLRNYLDAYLHRRPTRMIY